MSVLVRYGDIAVGAKEAFSLSATDQAYFSNLNQVKENISSFPNYGNPLERYSVILDGSVVALPSDNEEIDIGWWSGQLSDEDGAFETPITLNMISDEYFTATSLTITFDTYKDIYASELVIDWYRDDELLSSETFNPTSAKYSCENMVEFYNKIVITFNALNRPMNRLKIKSIDHGSTTIFSGENLKKCNISQKINPISAEIPIGTASLWLKGKEGEEYSFQKRQPLTIILNDSIQSTVFVNRANRRGKDEWEVQAEDYIGILDGTAFYGGIYENKNVGVLLAEIFGVAKVPFEIDESISASEVSGYIPFGTCRGALMQVAFAAGAMVDTSLNDLVRVSEMPTSVSQTIGRDRIYQGLQVIEDTRVTAVSISAHSYTPIEDTLTAYDASKSGAGQGIFVKFGEPLHDLSISNGEILESGSTYAIINAEDGCILVGKKYEHTSVIKTRKNDLVLATDTENVKTISKATLVSPKNIDKLLDLCYNYYSKTTGIKAKVVDRRHISGGDIIRYGQGIRYGEYKYRDRSRKVITYDNPVNLGDVIKIDTTYQGEVEGRVESKNFSLLGNSIAKDILIK